MIIKKVDNLKDAIECDKIDNFVKISPWIIDLILLLWYNITCVANSTTNVRIIW